MRKYLAIIVILTLAVTAYAKEIKRMAAEKPSVAVTPTAKSYLLASYSTATEWDIRRVADTSVVKLGGMDTTTADGTRYVAPYNTTACPADGPVGAICTLPTGVYWYGTVGGTTGWNPTGAGANEPISNGYVATAPTYSNEACTKGQWSVDTTYHYDCIATNTWDRFAYAGWSSLADTTPESFAGFTAKTGVATNTFVFAEPSVQITGISAPAAISVTGGSYKIDSGQWTTSPGTIGNGQWVSAGHTSAATNSATTTTTVTIGGVAGTFSSTTLSGAAVMYASQAGMTSGANVGYAANQWSAGAIVDAAGSHTVQKLKVYVRTVVDGGGLAAKQYKARIYNLSGTTFTTVSAESNNTVTGITGAGFIEFTFPANTTLAQGQAWMVYPVGAVDSANYFTMGYANTDATENPSGYSRYARWQSSGVIGLQDVVWDIRYELYE